MSFMKPSPPREASPYQTVSKQIMNFEIKLIDINPDYFSIGSIFVKYKSRSLFYFEWSNHYKLIQIFFVRVYFDTNWS